MFSLLNMLSTEINVSIGADGGIDARGNREIARPIDREIIAMRAC